MRVEQTSPTTFELQSDSGCHAVAGFALNTMSGPGVYFVKPGSGVTREQATALFLDDAKVKAALAQRVA